MICSNLAPLTAYEGSSTEDDLRDHGIVDDVSGEIGRVDGCVEHPCNGDESKDVEGPSICLSVEDEEGKDDGALDRDE